MSRPKIDGLALVAVLFVCFILLNLFRDRFDLASAAVMRQPAGEAVIWQDSIGLDLAVGPPAAQETSPEPLAIDEIQLDQDALQMPYAEYAVTQGIHGFEYGHSAIDITAGKGAQILSPINGLITANLTDPAGGTILVIENERWIITLVHGLFSASAGDFVHQGEVVGVESNQGNTVDMDGNSCRDKDCGYHTHINIYDKKSGQNVDPLMIFPEFD